MNSPVPASNRSLTLVGRLMLAEAVTFAIASILHFGVAETFIGAAIPETIIAVVLGAGALAVMRRAAFLVRLLDVLEADDVVGRPERIIDELAQLAGLLGELDDEVMLTAEVGQAALQDLGVAQDVVVAAAQDADDRLAADLLGHVIERR